MELSSHLGLTLGSQPRLRGFQGELPLHLPVFPGQWVKGQPPSSCFLFSTLYHFVVETSGREPASCANLGLPRILLPTWLQEQNGVSLHLVPWTCLSWFGGGSFLRINLGLF